MIIFQNSSLLDLRCLTTFGVNVKSDPSSAIGFFGTGLKYAIAVLLREDQAITLDIDKVSYQFFTKTENIRDKDFQLCFYRDRDGEYQLPFTLELGKSWTLENAYRELYSNCLDEQGKVSKSESPLSSENLTVFSIFGSAFEKVHENRDSFILPYNPSSAIFRNSSAEIYPFSSSSVFYRGIAAFSPSTPSAYTYNILDSMELTENRTMYYWHVESKIAELISATEHEGIIRTALAQAQPSWEHKLDFQYITKSDKFLAILAKLLITNSENLSPLAATAYYRSAGGALDLKTSPLPKEFEELQASAVKKILSCGIDITSFPILFSQNLSENVHACAYKGQIYLTKLCFSSEQYLLDCILEEYVHLRYGVKDETREMQNRILTLLSKVIQDKGTI